LDLLPSHREVETGDASCMAVLEVRFFLVHVSSDVLEHLLADYSHLRLFPI